MSKTRKASSTVPRSGQYEIIGPRGGRTGDKRTVIRGERLCPTPKCGQGYKIVDPTKHKNGR